MKLTKYLYDEERGFAGAYKEGIVTLEEAANGVAACIGSWVVNISEGAVSHSDEWCKEERGKEFAQAIATALREGLR